MSSHGVTRRDWDLSVCFTPVISFYRDYTSFTNTMQTGIYPKLLRAQLLFEKSGHQRGGISVLHLYALSGNADKR